MSDEYQTYPLGHVKLQRGQTLRNAFIAYKTFGVMNAEKDNIIVYPTWLESVSSLSKDYMMHELIYS
jgi:homoserine acetyltransferase